METFSALLAICAGNSPVSGEFPAQRPVTRSFDIFFGLRLNKRLSKQSWGWWFETLSCPLWRQCNGYGESYVWINTCHSFMRMKLLETLSCPLWRQCNGYGESYVWINTCHSFMRMKLLTLTLNCGGSLAVELEGTISKSAIQIAHDYL